MLEIPSDIYSHTKHLWDDIQAKLQSNTDDNTPFAMLPVRLETRFMKVRRKWSPYVQHEEIRKVWDTISFANDKFDSIANHNFSLASKEVAAYKEVEKSLTKSIDLVTADQSLYSSGAKSAINESTDFLKASIAAKIESTNSNADLTADQKTQLVENLNAIDTQCNDFRTLVNNKAGGTDATASDTTIERELIENKLGLVNSAVESFLPRGVRFPEATKSEIAFFDEIIEKMSGYTRESLKNVDELIIILEETSSDIERLSSMISELRDLDDERKLRLQISTYTYESHYDTVLVNNSKISEGNRTVDSLKSDITTGLNGIKGAIKHSGAGEIEGSMAVDAIKDLLSDMEEMSSALSRLDNITEEDKSWINSKIEAYLQSSDELLVLTSNIPLDSKLADSFISDRREVNLLNPGLTEDVSRMVVVQVPVYQESDLLSLWKSPIETGVTVRPLQFSQYQIVSELWVRIFPDDIHVHTHENPLTQEEIDAGVIYWNTWWNSGGDMEIRKGAWKQLCELYGPERAAWIIKQLTPTNLPVEPVDDDSVLQWVDTVAQASADFVGNTVISDIYPVGGVGESANSFMRMSESLVPEISRARISSDAKEKVSAIITEFETEMSGFSKMVSDANESPVDINEATLIEVDYVDGLKDLSNSLLSFRDPRAEFNVEEWMNELNSSEERVLNLVNQIERGDVSLNSLREANKEGNRLLGNVEENRRILVALENGDGREDPYYTVIQQRVGDHSGTIPEVLEGVSRNLTRLTDAASVKVKDIKTSRIKFDTEGIGVLQLLLPVYGQIKQNINSTPEPEPWDVFDHLPTDPADIVIPDVTKEGSWTQAPKTFVMPDRFVAIGLDEDVNNTSASPDYGKNTYTFKQLEVGNLVPAELQLGVDPSNEDVDVYTQTEDGNLIVDEGMEWMVDFTEAVNNGMGIIMKLEEDFTHGQDANVFDKLVVMGVKVEKDRFHKPDAEKDYSGVDLKTFSKELMEELLINHHYKEEGMGIVSIGTATNNTEDADAGWKFDEVHFEDSFAVETLNNLFPIRTSHLEQRNGQRLAEALGVDYSIFQHISNAGSTEIGDAFKLNHMLWHGTVGNYLQEMLSGLVSRSNYERVKKYFEKYVSARGILPTLRVGNQPYGFLPTTSFTKWSFGTEFDESDFKHPALLNENTLHDSEGLPSRDYYDLNRWSNHPIANKRFDDGFKKLMDLLQNRWYGIFHQPGMIKHVNGVSGTDDFMQALALQASTAEIQLRFPYSNANLFEGSNPNHPNSFGTVAGSSFFGMNGLGSEWVNLVKNGLFHENAMAFSEDNIVNHIQYLNAYFRIYKNPIDKYKLSENQLINRTIDNYIEWIRTADLRYVWDPASAPSDPFDGGVQPLLFKMLRQSYMMMHLDAFVDVSVKSGLLDPNTYHRLGNGARTISSLITTSGGNIGGENDRFSKWTYLLENISDFGGSTGAFESLYDYKVGLDQYLIDKNITLDTTDITFAQHVQNYYSPFWKLKGGYYNRRKIADMDLIYRDAKSWSTAHIDRMFREHMDLGSYRLDAWMNGFVNRRLERTRKSYSGTALHHVFNGQRQREKGVYIGAYGWLENVKPGGVRTPVTEADKLPASLELENTTIFTDADNLGFIHGPSMYHAMTAAILRSGYASNEDITTDTENPMAVNLSSERVRMASNLWQGIKNGQSLGALLGYQLERNLHELYTVNPAWELDTYIYRLRKKYMVDEYHSDSTPGTTESIPAQNVVDGVSLLGDIRQEMLTDATPLSLHDYVELHIGGSKIFSIDVTDPGIQGALAREIDLMANAIDALGDLAVAEGVFQLSKGNFDRVSTTIDTLLENRNLPMPEILDTPRTGAMVSHRFCVNMESGVDNMGGVINPWSGVALTPKASAAPHINQFMAKYFVAPDSIKCLVSYVDTDDTTIETEVSVEDLGWQPIDFYVNLMGAMHNDRSEELLEKISHYVRQNNSYDGNPTIPVDVPLTILLNEKGTTWTTADYAMLELLPVMENLGKVLGEIKPTKIQDFKLPQLASVDDAYGWDLADLDTRVRAAHTSLTTLATSILTDYELLLTSAGEYNVKNASPASNDVSELETQWLAVQAELVKLKDAASAILDDPDNGALLAYTGINDEKKWKKYLEVAQIIFGADFTLLPVLDLTTDATDVALTDYLTNSQTDLMSQVGTGGFDQDVLGQWFYGLSRLRSKLGAFESLTDFESLSDFENTADLTFSPIQFPYASDTDAGTHDYWYGWEFPDEYEHTGNKTSVVMTNKALFAAAPSNGKMIGFILDEWSEMIPEKVESSGIAFHYDQPNTKPAQNVLLAVTPEFTGNWDGNDILFTLLDTLKMSKVRLVEPEHLQKDEFLGKYLPTIYSMIELPGRTILNSYDLVAEYMELTQAE